MVAPARPGAWGVDGIVTIARRQYFCRQIGGPALRLSHPTRYSPSRNRASRLPGAIESLGVWVYSPVTLLEAGHDRGQFVKRHLAFLATGVSSPITNLLASG
jgi:hypothetical protein